MWKILLVLFALAASFQASASDAGDIGQSQSASEMNLQLPAGDVVRWKDMPRDLLPDHLEVRGGRVFYHGVRIKGGARYLQGVLRASDAKAAKRLVGRQLIHLGAGASLTILFSGVTVAFGVGIVEIVIFAVASTVIYATSPSNRKIAQVYSEWAAANPDQLERPIKL